MLLTITTTHRPATDLGYLLHKNPAHVHTKPTSFGATHVFYPEASAERCTAALLLAVDPVALVRGRPGASDSGPLAQYVNDRPYVASSFLSVALSEVFRTALSGRSRERPELAEQALPLTARLAVVPCRGGPELLPRLFEPLGYRVTASRRPLDPQFADWGDSRYHALELEGRLRLRDLLAHLYVLMPVLDDEKHYWVGEDEVGKLLRYGEGWLAAHPERELIAARYLKHRPSLAREALARLLEGEEAPPEESPEALAAETAGEQAVSLNTQRLQAVVEALCDSEARRVLDLGCGEGRLLRLLTARPQFTELVGVDVSCRALEAAAERLHLERLPEAGRERLRLLQGSLTYRDRRLEGFDAAAVVEVIEHLDPGRLAAFERSLFEFARPATVVLTTPNAEYNVKWPDLSAGQWRHRDHRFEWTRPQFQAWTRGLAARYGYTVQCRPVGPLDEAVGAPTQLAVFCRD